MSEKRVSVWVQHFKDRESLVLQWIDPETGRRKSRTAGTADPKEAEAARTDLESDLNNGRYQEASRMTWERFRELFESEYVAACRANTRENYAETLNLFERLCNPAKLRSISERTISRFKAAMETNPTRGRDGMMPSTIKVRLQFLHTALQWAVEQKMIPAVPKFPSVKVPKKRPQPIPLESFERLLNKAPDDNMRAFLLCGWLAGLRLGEAVALEWEPTESAPYVDFCRKRIVIPATFSKAVEDQWVPIDPALQATLEALPRDGAKVFRFPSSRGGELTLSGVSDRVVYLAKKAGVRLTMHSLRKGFGCRYAGKVSAHVLQRLMRHANIKTTLDYYANIDTAVEEAILGVAAPAQRNTLRNTNPQEAGSLSNGD
jgi:integrase